MKNLKHFVFGIWAMFAFQVRNVAMNKLEEVAPGLMIGWNDSTISDEEWVKITPWGDFPNSKGLQRVTQEDGEKMVAAFNTLKQKQGKHFRGAPIFVGHPDVLPDVYKDHRRHGRLEGLEVRPDGLYCKPAYNNIGEENKKEGYFVYPSPVWKFNRAGNVIRPFELLSIGLTNSPNIAGSAPWADNVGTSEGAKKGWAKRKGAGWAPKTKKGKAVLSKKANRTKQLMEAGFSQEEASAGAKKIGSRRSAQARQDRKVAAQERKEDQPASRKAAFMQRNKVHSDRAAAFWQSQGGYPGAAKKESRTAKHTRQLEEAGFSKAEASAGAKKVAVRRRKSAAKSAEDNLAALQSFYAQGAYGH